MTQQAKSQKNHSSIAANSGNDKEAKDNSLLGDLQNQVIDLQSTVAHLELSIEHLDTVITNQDKQLLDMQRQLQLMFAQLNKQSNSDIAHFDAATDIPPHY